MKFSLKREPDRELLLRRMIANVTFHVVDLDGLHVN